VTLVLILIFFCILYPDRASSGPYLDSAHGSSSYGVKRSAQDFPTDYTRGLCAHCHEQHASIGGVEPDPTGTTQTTGPAKYELFRDLFTRQGSMFCYSCHGTGDTQVQTLSQQFNYSRIAGGDNNNCPTDIRETFRFVDNSGNPRSNCGSNVGSAHFLDDIRDFLRNRWGLDDAKVNIDPCSGCHNPHRAQRDPHTSPGRIGADGKLVSSVSRSSQHTDLMMWELWGDDDTERMNKYNYQPPYRYNSTNTYEPDGDATNDASRTVDYVSFCTDCHNTDPNQPWSTRLTRDLRQIDWSANGDIHGMAAPQTCCDKGDKKPPYSEGVNYVLSCLDCHEPHGSPNEYLLRQEVNSIQVPTITTLGRWYNFCSSCHTNLNTPLQKHVGGILLIDPDSNCIGCHYHGFYNYSKPQNCTSCPGNYVKTF
jgi:hypothetical protein